MRAQKTAEMTMAFILDDIFPALQNDEQLTTKYFLDKLKKHAPNIKTKISPLSEDSIHLGYCGGLNKIHGFSNRIKGFEFEFPSKQDKYLSLDKIITYGHESAHFFRAILSPKFTCRENLPSLPFRLLINRNSPFHFYRDKLYTDSIDLSKYEGKEEKVKKGAIRKVKKEIQEYFQRVKPHSNNKIDILQAWRHFLMNEKCAYETELELIKRVEPSEHESRQKIINNMLLDEKIELISQMLKQEIKSHRKEHAKYLRKNPPKKETSMEKFQRKLLNGLVFLNNLLGERV